MTGSNVFQYISHSTLAPLFIEKDLELCIFLLLAF